MEINSKLNLVIPLRRADDGATLVWGYHTPISPEIFEANFRILAATKAELFAKGRNYLEQVGPQIAALLLKDEAGRSEESEGAIALLADLKRLTLVMAPGPNGWEQVPVEIAMGRGLIDAEDWKEAESGIVFFTCLYSICARSSRKKMAEGSAAVLGGSMTSSSVMEYVAFLQKSTITENSSKTAA